MVRVIGKYDLPQDVAFNMWHSSFNLNRTEFKFIGEISFTAVTEISKKLKLYSDKCIWQLFNLSCWVEFLFCAKKKINHLPLWAGYD